MPSPHLPVASALRLLGVFLTLGLLGCGEPTGQEDLAPPLEIYLEDMGQDTPDDMRPSSPPEEMGGAPDQGAPPRVDEDMGEQAAPAEMGRPPACGEAAALGGRLYLDTDASSLSLYEQEVGPEDEALEGLAVRLLGEDTSWRTSSCEDGSFGFALPPDGAYVLEPQREADWLSTSSSHGERFVEAIEARDLEVVVFGDSVPAYGPQPWFPERFAALSSTLAEVTLHNIAEPGTRSDEWLPGTRLHDQVLLPQVAEADVIVFSLGGNDLYQLAAGGVDTSDVNALIDEFDATVETTKDNIRTILTELRLANPGADIIWLLYPNYATSQEWATLAGDYISLVDRILRRTLAEIRREMAHHERFLLWDMYAAIGQPDRDLDDYLSDPLHLNAAGHELWARELFQLLGGVIVESGAPAHSPRLMGFAPTTSK